MALRRAEAASEVMWHLVTHDAHGYSQPHRAGDGTTEELYLSDGEKVTIHGGDYDCSEAVRMCYAAVGVLPCDSYMWTGNERRLLESHDFAAIFPWYAQDGDVLLTDGHTEMIIAMDGDLLQAGFRHSEDYDIHGEQGDQTGDEASYSEFCPEEWEIAFRYCGPEKDDEQKGDEQIMAADTWGIVGDEHATYVDMGSKIVLLNDSYEQDFVEWYIGQCKVARDRGEVPHVSIFHDADGKFQRGDHMELLLQIVARPSHVPA